MNNEEFEQFRRLRRDIQEYLDNNLKSLEHYFVLRIAERAKETELDAALSFARKERWQEYETHKRNLSTLCGKDAPSELYDQDLFDRAVKYIIDRLLL